MSWIWPHPAEYESSPPVDIPTRVTAFDGRAWIETREFPSEDAAADYARATYSADDIADGLVGLVPAPDPFEDFAAEVGR